MKIPFLFAQNHNNPPIIILLILTESLKLIYNTDLSFFHFAGTGEVIYVYLTGF